MPARSNAERRRDDFAKLERRIEQYQRQKAKSFVTLNEEKFFAERAEFDADKEDEANLKEQMETERPVFRTELLQRRGPADRDRLCGTARLGSKVAGDSPGDRPQRSARRA